ncbi:MAG: carboxy terminal-processing peptidase, partial [Acidobacteria bacterium]|nr:carboxy terminal-processing peptidase [Acidobacteriota bacterium]
LILLLSLLLTGALPPAESAPEREKVLSKMIANWLANWHYSARKIDDDFSAKSFARYTKLLDSGRSFLVQADLDALKAYVNKIDDGVLAGDFALPRLGRQLLRQRLIQVQGFAREILAQPCDFSKDEEIELDADKREPIRDLTQLRAWWRQWLKYLTLTQYINLQRAAAAEKNGALKPVGEFSPELEAKARQAVTKSVERLFSRLLQERSEETQALFFNALTLIFDPHSQYFPPRAKEEFDIDMSGTLEGIGALLGEDNGFIKIFDVIPGSPAWIQGILKVEDIVLKVGQGDEEPVDIVGMSVSDAARLVRGRKGSLVRLTVRKPDGRILPVALVRNVVELQETYARSAVIVNDQMKRQFGYIYLPKFYHDFNRAGGRNAGDDVRKEIGKLTARSVDGMILDLRGNGGGALDDAVKLSGLFFEKGPVVQVKDRHSAAQVYEDRDGEISYAGPLVVLVNSLSASSSEIVAAVLQDYQRAIIIGDQTFGKGTVQVMLDLDRFLSSDLAHLKPLGALTLTVQKYYRITGGSTQYQGVVPDILLPEPYAYLEVGEKSEENSLPWDTVAPLSFSLWPAARPDWSEIRKRSLERLAENPRFQQVAESTKRLKKQRQQTRVSLNLKKFQAEQEALFQQAERTSRQQVEFPHLRALPSEDPASGTAAWPDEGKRREWLDGLRKDPIIEEAIQVLNDLRSAPAAR